MTDPDFQEVKFPDPERCDDATLERLARRYGSKRAPSFVERQYLFRIRDEFMTRLARQRELRRRAGR